MKSALALWITRHWPIWFVGRRSLPLFLIFMRLGSDALMREIYPRGRP